MISSLVFEWCITFIWTFLKNYYQSTIEIWVFLDPWQHSLSTFGVVQWNGPEMYRTQPVSAIFICSGHFVTGSKEFCVSLFLLIDPLHFCPCQSWSFFSSDSGINYSPSEILLADESIWKEDDPFDFHWCYIKSNAIPNKQLWNEKLFMFETTDEFSIWWLWT